MNDRGSIANIVVCLTLKCIFFLDVPLTGWAPKLESSRYALCRTEVAVTRNQLSSKTEGQLNCSICLVDLYSYWNAPLMKDGKAPTEIATLISVALNYSEFDVNNVKGDWGTGSVSTALPYFSGGHLTMPGVDAGFSAIGGVILTVNCLIDTFPVHVGSV